MICTAQTKYGVPCQIRALSGSDVCYFHAPQSQKERQAAQSRGGRAHTRSVAALPIDEFDLTQPAGIQQMLTIAANLLRAGRLDAKRVHALGHLADCALKTYTLVEGKKQLDRIEQLLDAQQNRPADPAAADEMLRFAPEEEFEIAARRRLQNEANGETNPEPPLDPDYVPTWSEVEEEIQKKKK